MAALFSPPIPAPVVIQALREFCHQTAMATVSKLIEGEANRPDVTLSADQKQHFMDLWASTVFALGATAHDRSTQQLCVAAAEAGVAIDPRQANIQAVAGSIVAKTTEAEGRGNRIAAQLLDQAFGSGTFDHKKTTRACPAADLGMCIRWATHLMQTHKVRF